MNTRLLMPGKLDGIGWFTYETLRRIVRSHPETHFYFLFDRPFKKELVFAENVTPVVMRPPARHPLLWFIWLEWRVNGFLRRKRPDLFLSTDGFLSLRSRVPTLLVIHDINFEHRPGDLPWLAGNYFRFFFPRFARKATRIVTVSEYSRRDLINQYDLEEECVDLVYNGVNDRYHPIPEDRADQVRDEVTAGCPYFIFVGSLHPRKNVTNLLKAFQLFKEENKGNFKLVIVGEKFFLNRSMEEQLERMANREDVVFVGRLPPDRLNEVLGAAFALTFVPFFEGFGIPLVEAMKCDIPVIASKVTSLPEIAGEAAIYAAPESPGSIRDALIRIVREEGLRDELIRKGRERREMFSWDKTAEGLWNSMLKVLERDA